MNRNFAVISGDQVANVIIINDADQATIDALNAKLVPAGLPVAIGWGWVAGAFVAPPSPPVVIPTVVTMRQARLALLQSDMLDQVNAAVVSMPGTAGEAARIEWEFSSTVERNRPLVQSLTTALGLTDAQLDDLFTLAATL